MQTDPAVARLLYPFRTQSPLARRSETVAPASEAVTVRLSDVKPEEIEWLWPGRIPRGKLTLVVGDPGLGKSYLLLDVAACLTTGQAWPDGGAAPREGVVLLTAEDGLADTVRPRLDALGGDAGKVTVLRAVRREGVDLPFTLRSDLPVLETVITESRAGLVIVDPLSAYLGRADSFKDSECRALLAPLAALAEKHRVAVVAVLHLSKDQQRRALYRAQGSIAFVAAARAVFALAAGPDDPARRLLTPLKLNLAPLPPTLAFRITGTGLEWEAKPVDVDAETILGGPPRPDEQAARQDAESFLLELLKDGRVAAAEVFKAAKANGITERTLNRAKQRLSVIAEREGGIAARGAWFWSMPLKAANDTAKVASPLDVATLAQPSEEKAENADTSTKIANREDMATLDAGDGNLSRGQASLWPEAGQCHACGGRHFWRSIYGQVRCHTCHPPAAPELVAAQTDLG